MTLICILHKLKLAPRKIVPHSCKNVSDMASSGSAPILNAVLHAEFGCYAIMWQNLSRELAFTVNDNVDVNYTHYSHIVEIIVEWKPKQLLLSGQCPLLC